MTKDHGPIFQYRESIEPHPHSKVAFTIVLVGILLIQVDWGCMGQNKLPAIYLYFNVEGQAVQIFKYLLSDRFLNVL